MDTSYFIAEVRKREELESFAIKRFESIFENRKKESLANVQRFGLQGYIRYLESAPYPLGWEKEWGNILMQYMREWVGLGYNRSQREIKAELLKSAADPFQKQINSAVSYWDSYGLKLSQVEDQDVINRVISQLQFGINKGLPIGDMQALLGKTLDTFKASRLENIARTESGKAYNWGIINNIYENSDICQYMEVMVVMDKRTTDICIARNGIVIPIKDTSMVAQYTPPFHFQCRTRLVAIVRPSTIKNLPPDKELIKRASEIEKNIPIFNGFGLSPDDMKIFETAANKVWIMEDLRKPVAKKVAKPIKKISTTNNLVTKPRIKKDQNQSFVDKEEYFFQATNTPDENKAILKKKMDEYHQLLQRDKIFEKGVHIKELSPTTAASIKLHPNPSKYGKILGAGDMEFRLNSSVASMSPEKYKITRMLRIKKKLDPLGCETLDSLIDHEMGHAIHELISRTSMSIEFNKRATSIYNSFRNQYALSEEYKEYSERFGYTLAQKKLETKTKAHFKNNLSSYSYKNYHEMLAEGWAEYMNNPNPRPMAKKIGELFTKYIQKLVK